MKRFIPTAALALFAVLITGALRADGGENDKISVPLSDPSRPAFVKVGLINGSITVKGYSGKEILVETSGRQDNEEEEDNGEDESAAKRKGLHRIPNTSGGLSVEEDNNEVTIGTGIMGASRTVDLIIEVPTSTSMKLSTINDGDITVSNVKGDIEASNTNGSIKLTGISGSAVADALNGEISVVFAALDTKKSMSFSSLNGDIDLTFPADVRASLKMKTEQGEIYSDFDMKIGSSNARVEDNTRGGRGKYKVSIDKMMTASINGGGADILVKNFNGSIYIRKGK